MGGRGSAVGGVSFFEFMVRLDDRAHIIYHWLNDDCQGHELWSDWEWIDGA